MASNKDLDFHADGFGFGEDFPAFGEPIILNGNGPEQGLAGESHTDDDPVVPHPVFSHKVATFEPSGLILPHHDSLNESTTDAIESGIFRASISGLQEGSTTDDVADDAIGPLDCQSIAVEVNSQPHAPAPRSENHSSSSSDLAPLSDTAHVAKPLHPADSGLEFVSETTCSQSDPPPTHAHIQDCAPDTVCVPPVLDSIESGDEHSRGAEHEPVVDSGSVVSNTVATDEVEEKSEQVFGIESPVQTAGSSDEPGSQQVGQREDDASHADSSVAAGSQESSSVVVAREESSITVVEDGSSTREADAVPTGVDTLAHTPPAGEDGGSKDNSNPDSKDSSKAGSHRPSMSGFTIEGSVAGTGDEFSRRTSTESWVSTGSADCEEPDAAAAVASPELVAAALGGRTRVSRSVAERVAKLLPARSAGALDPPRPARLSASVSSGSILARVARLQRPRTLADKLSEMEEAAAEKYGGKLVVYTSSMRAIKTTANACNKLRRLLQALRVLYEERDVFMSAQFSEEFQQRCPNQRVPQVFCNGKHIGDADAFAELNDSGELATMFATMPRIPVHVRGECGQCDGQGFFTCTWCGGDKQSMCARMGGELVKLRCTACNENGLMRCTACLKPVES